MATSFAFGNSGAAGSTSSSPFPFSTAASAFGSSAAAAFSAPAFGSPPASASAPAAASPPSPFCFGATGFGVAQPTTSSASPAFTTSAAATKPSLFGTTTTAPSLVGAPANSSAATTPTLFGARASSAASTPGLFGATSTPAITPGLFGVNTAAAAPAPSLLGAVSSAASTPGRFSGAATVFGSGSGSSASGATTAGTPSFGFNSAPAASSTATTSASSQALRFGLSGSTSPARLFVNTATSSPATTACVPSFGFTPSSGSSTTAIATSCVFSSAPSTTASSLSGGYPLAISQTVSAPSTFSNTGAAASSCFVSSFAAPTQILASVSATSASTVPSASAAPATSGSLFSASAYSPHGFSFTVPPSASSLAAVTATTTTFTSSSTSAAVATTASRFPNFSLQATTQASSSTSVTSSTLFGTTPTSTSAIITTTTQTTSAAVPASTTGLYMPPRFISTINAITPATSHAPKLPSEIVGEGVEEIIRDWNNGLQDRTAKFPKLATTISERDRRILQNRNVPIRDEANVAKVVETQEEAAAGKPSSVTTIDLLPEDTILEVFSRLPSIACVIYAACSCSAWKKAVASSPAFRRKFLGLRPTPLLGLFFDPPSNAALAFPTFVPARDVCVDLPLVVRLGDFFSTELQRQPVVPPNWAVSDVRGGLMLLVNPDDILLVVNPLQGISEGYFDPHKVRILMDYRGTNPRMLQAHLVCDEAYTGRFTVICLAHDVSRVRAAVFGSSIGGRGFSLPWFDVIPRQNQLDDEDDWLAEGVQAGGSIYWIARNHQYVVILDTTTLLFSVQHLPDLNLNNLGSYVFGETNGRLCLAFAHGPRLVIMCCLNNHNISGPWDILHEGSLQDLAIIHGELRVAGVRKGLVYLIASRMFHEYGVPCWIATYDMQNQKVEVKCQWMSSDRFQPFHLPWPRFLSSQGQASAARAQKHLQKFEKMNEVNDIVLVKAVYSCQLDVLKNPQDYRLWYKYIVLEKEHGDQTKVKGIYEQALSSPPVDEEKWFWKSYIYLWLSYAIYEEETGNIQSARQVYTRCLGVIPHQIFSFSAVWTMAADLEIRQKDVDAARRILRAGIENRPTAKLYKRLIHIEYWMSNHVVWRGLYETFLESMPLNSLGWMDYAEKEHRIGEPERARAIYERALQQPSLDLPIKVLLKDYLYFEISESEADNARALFEKLLIVTKDVEAWINYAKYEASDDSNNSNEMDRIQRCRSVFKRALAHYNNCGEVDERAQLIKAWTEHEKSFGVCGTEISPEYLLSSNTLKRKRFSSSHDILIEKRRKKDAGDDHRPLMKSSVN